MRIPKQFELGGATWTVEQIPNLSDLGETQRDLRLIHIRKNAPKEHKEQTFCHELTHAIKFTMGETDHDEKEVDAFATFLHQFLKSAKYR